jgi:thiol:disulfide interchange protein DsbG
MKLFRNATAAVALLVLTANLVQAETPSPAVDPSSVPALTQLVAQGKRPHFLRRDDKLKLNLWWLETQNGEPGLVYTTLDGDYLFLGYVLDSQLKPLTTDHIAEAKAVMGVGAAPSAAATPASASPAPAVAQAPGPSGKSASMLKALSSASTIELGNRNAPLAYVIVDPRCPYCHIFLDKVAPAIDAGKIRLRVLVSNALASSASDATAILGSKHPVEMLKAAFFPGGPRAARPESADEAKANQDLGMERLQVNENTRLLLDKMIGDGGGVPLIIYRSKSQGGKVGTVRGAPADVNGLVADTANIDG